MKPKTTQYYETSDGTPVKTLAEWKQAEVLRVINDAGIDDPEVVKTIIQKSDRLIEILSIKEKGRPNGAKDRKPRKRTIEVTTPAPVA